MTNSLVCSRNHGLGGQAQEGQAREGSSTTADLVWETLILHVYEAGSIFSAEGAVTSSYQQAAGTEGFEAGPNNPIQTSEEQFSTASLTRCAIDDVHNPRRPVGSNCMPIPFFSHTLKKTVQNVLINE